MSDLPDRFEALGADVDGLPRPSAAQVRRAAYRNAVIRGSAATAAIAAVAFGGGFAATRLVGDDRPVALGPTASPAPSATRTPLPTGTPADEAAWLPPPWRLVSATTHTWAPGAASRFTFCGRRIGGALRPDPVTVSEQRLAHPSGRRAHLLLLTPDRPEEAIQLWKLTYANCLVPGRAEGVPGPRNLWSYRDTAGAADLDAPTTRVVEVSGARATRADAAAVLDAWRARG